VQHYLKELEKVQVLKSEIRGKIKEYSINKKHELTLKVFSILEMKGRQKFYQKNPKLAVWIQMALEKMESIDSANISTDIFFIILFGSVARGEAREKSDIDLLVVVKNKNESFENEIREEIKKKIGAISGRVFSTHILDIQELRFKWMKEPVYSTIWLDHITLYGEQKLWKEVLKMGEPI
jgi:predicted nucleotidyltransferase